MAVLRPGEAPKLLTSLELKSELIAALGVEELVILPFDEGFARQSASEFIDGVLVEQLGATHVSVGTNFRFGRSAGGTTTLLAADPRFQARVVPLVEGDGAIVSSSRIRALVADGTGRSSGRPAGPAVPDPGRGGLRRPARARPRLSHREPGSDPGLVCPANGVYACRIGKQTAAVNVGVRPTFGDGQALLVEAFVLDFKGDLYGQTLTIEFVARLRGEERFTGADTLITQMARDVERTRELLGSTTA